MSGYITPRLATEHQGAAPPESLLADGVETLDRGPAPLAAAGTYTLTNHGGSVIAHPRLVLIVPGDLAYDANQIDQFAADLMEGGYLDGLAPYGSGRGTYWGMVHVQDARFAPGMTVTSGVIEDVIHQAQQAGSIPQPDANTLFMVLAPQGVIVSDSNHSCEFCGWHTSLTWDGGFYYGVICDTGASCCHAQFTPLQAACMVLAHEVAEACTDAVPGRGWYCDANGYENADLCAWQAVRYGPWTVQPYWTNEHGPYVGPYEDHHSNRAGGGSQGGGNQGGGQSGGSGQGSGSGQGDGSQGGSDPYAPLFAWVLLAAQYAATYRSVDELRAIAATLHDWGLS